MRIDELFEKYPNNIIGFRVNKTTKIIDFWLNNSWELRDEVRNGIMIKKQKTDDSNQRSYYIIYSETFDFEVIFDELCEIIEYNLDIERKQMLFSKKMDELKNLFITLSYDELKKLTFDTAIIDPTSSVVDDNNNYTYTPEVIEVVKDETIIETKKSKKSKKQVIEKQIEEDEEEYLESEVIEGNVNNIQPVNLN
jgi:hypothetical protein